MTDHGDAHPRRPPPSESPMLPADRAFVVQFATHESGNPAPRTGRVEHVVSGRATQFESWEHLYRFVEEVLVGAAAKSPSRMKEERR